MELGGWSWEAELGAGSWELGVGSQGDLGRFEFPAFPEVVGDVKRTIKGD